MPARSIRWFLVFFVPMVLAGAALILLAPAIANRDGSVPVWVPLVLALVVVGCGTGAKLARPDRESGGGGVGGAA